MLRGTLIASFLAFGTSALAQTPGQPVSASGVVSKAGPLTICSQPVTHRLDCTNVLLMSTSGVDLDAVVGKIVKVTGTYVGVTCDVIDVTAVEAAVRTLTMCGSPGIGCPLRFTLCPGEIGVHLLFASTAPHFIPINLNAGSLLISPPLVLVSSGMQGFPCTNVDVSIPGSAFLVGVDIHLQAVMQAVGPVKPPVLTNPVCFSMLPSLLFCIDPTGC